MQTLRRGQCVCVPARRLPVKKSPCRHAFLLFRHGPCARKIKGQRPFRPLFRQRQRDLGLRRLAHFPDHDGQQIREIRGLRQLPRQQVKRGGTLLPASLRRLLRAQTRRQVPHSQRHDKIGEKQHHICRTADAQGE